MVQEVADSGEKFTDATFGADSENILCMFASMEEIEWIRASEIACFKDEEGNIEWFRRGGDIEDDYLIAKFREQNTMLNQCFGFMLRMSDSSIH